MSYGIIHMQKFQSGAVRGIQIHNERERESQSNPDIDTSKSGQNYAIIECSNYHEKIKENIAQLELKKNVRKDAVVMCGFVITSDHDFFQNFSAEKEKEFFQKSVQFIEDRYGKNNVLSAKVHKDEKTPHLHVYITPIREGKLSAKNIFTRAELISLQTDFYEQVGKSFGLQRGEQREEKRRHLDTEEFKLKTKKEELEKKAESLQFHGNEIPFEEFEPQALESKFLGLGTKKETPAEVAQRISSEYVKPLSHKIKQLQDENKTLKHAVATQDVVVEKFNKFKEIFMKNMTQEQFDILVKQAKTFQAENISAEKSLKEKREKERLEKLELEKELKLLLKQRDKSYLKGLGHDAEVAEYIKIWEKTENKQEYAVKIKKALKKESVSKESNIERSRQQSFTRMR